MVSMADVIGLLEAATLQPPGVILPETRFDEMSGWDSMGVVFVMGEALARWQIQLSADDLMDVRSVHDLHGVVASKSA